MSDIVDLYIEAKSGWHKFKGIEVESDLDIEMPSVFESLTEKQIFSMLSQVTLEAEDANAKKIRYQTKYDTGIQTLTISHNGNAVPTHALSWLNERLEEIAAGTAEHYDRHGNLLAAQHILPLYGRIRLENIPGNEYKVATIVEIPYKYQ